MLFANPIHIASRTFEVRNVDRSIGRLSIGWFLDDGSITLAGQELRLRRQGLYAGRFELKSAGNVIATAVKPSFFRNRFEIEFGKTSVVLERVGLGSRSFLVRRGPEVLGRISPAHALSRKAIIDLPSDWPPALQLFMFWLVLIIWKRLNSA